jgi:hypothetical protein
MRALLCCLFFLNTFAAETNTANQLGPPYPQSGIIKAIHWAPKSEIIRMAKGSDNWPATWAKRISCMQPMVMETGSNRL